MLKVLIVDDSKLIRSMLREMIDSAPDLCVVGEAADPYDARDKIKSLSADVLTLDIEMPKMNGITFLRNLMRLRPMPVVMLSTLTAQGAPATLEALSIGAVDFLEKPKSNVLDALPRYTQVLIEKLRAAAGANVSRFDAERTARIAKRNPTKTHAALSFRSNHIVAIGASTGGTEAIKDVVINLPDNFPPVVVTQHIPPVFSTTYAERLNSLAAMRVFEADDGQTIQSGCVYIAPGDKHLKILRHGSTFMCKLEQSEPVNRHRPSVDVMFDSLVQLEVKDCTAVLLTGMGADGAQGLLRLRQLGVNTLTQDEATCVVYGMPRAAVELGAATQSLPLSRISDALINAALKPA